MQLVVSNILESAVARYVGLPHTSSIAKTYFMPLFLGTEVGTLYPNIIFELYNHISGSTQLLDVNFWKMPIYGSSQKPPNSTQQFYERPLRILLAMVMVAEGVYIP